MVKQVVVQECHTKYLRDLKNNGRLNVGLIVGKVCNAKDFVVRLIACPAQCEDGVTEDFDPSWVAGHAAQVVPCLPGGVHIIGVFVAAPLNSAKSIEIKAKAMLYQSYKLVSKSCSDVDNHFQSDIRSPDDDSLFWTMVHIDPNRGHAVSCRQFDVKDNKDVGRPAEWKQLDSPVQWDCLKTRILLNHTLTTNKNINRAHAMKSALQPLGSKIAKAYIMIENNQRNGSDVLSPSGSGHASKKSKKSKSTMKSSAVETCKNYYCEVFLPQGGSDEMSQDAASEWSETKLELYGTITGLAFAPPGTTVDEAIYSLKQDLMQSMYQRCQILTEDVGDGDGDIFSPDRVTWPCRVVCHDTAGNQGERILFSDYLLPGEPFEDCAERIKDNLHLITETGDFTLESSIEQFPLERIIDLLDDRTALLPACEKSSASSKRNLLLAAAAAAVAALGWVFSEIALFDS